MATLDSHIERAVYARFVAHPVTMINPEELEELSEELEENGEFIEELLRLTISQDEEISKMQRELNKIKSET